MLVSATRDLKTEFAEAAEGLKMSKTGGSHDMGWRDWLLLWSMKQNVGVGEWPVLLLLLM